MRKLKDITNEKFGRLTVISYHGLLKNGKQKASYWNCVCICGNTVVVSNNNLKRGQTKSCGCLQKERAKYCNINDISGLKFGMLEVKKYLYSKNRSTYWECLCECGKTKAITTNCLISGKNKSCGCKQGWWRSPKPGLWKDSAAYAKWIREDPVKKLRHSVSNSIRGMLKHKGSYKRKKSIRNFLPYTIEELKLHIESLWEPWMTWDNYGGKSDNPEKTWQIDHIIPHSSFYYTSMEDNSFLQCWALSNLRPLEKIENISKGAK